MKGIVDLKGLISELEKAKVTFETQIEKYVDELVAKIFQLIGVRTAYDNGVTREIVMNIISKDLKNPTLAQTLITEIYQYWNTLEKRLKQDKGYTFSKSKVNSEIIYDVEIDDYGFSNQAIDGELSIKHPRGLDSKLRPFMVDFVLDKVSTGTESEISMEINNLLNKISKLMEGDLS